MHNWAFISAYITSIITSFYSRYKYNIAPYIDDHIFELRRFFLIWYITLFHVITNILNFCVLQWILLLNFGRNNIFWLSTILLIFQFLYTGWANIFRHQEYLCSLLTLLLIKYLKDTQFEFDKGNVRFILFHNYFTFFRILE